MQKRIDNLTSEQEQMAHQHAGEWIKNGLSGKFDEAAFREGVKLIYELINKKSPEKIIIADCPYSALMIIDLLKKASVRASVGASVRASVLASVGDSVWDSVRASVGASVGASWNERCGYGDMSDIAFCAWAEFYYKLNLECVQNHPYAKRFIDYIRSNPFFVWFYEDAVIVCKPPTKILRNQAGRLHNERVAAVEFANGTKMYFFNGRSIPSWVYEKEITKEMFLSETNTEIRAAMYGRLGQNAVFEMFDCTLVDEKEANRETYKLYKSKSIEPMVGERLAWVQVKCPSTNTMYLLGVEPSHEDAHEAVASTFGMTKSEYFINQHT